MIGDIIYNDLNTTGRLEADGSFVSETEYPELVSILQQWHTTPDINFSELVAGTPEIDTTLNAIAEDTNNVYLGGSFFATPPRIAAVRKSDWTLIQINFPGFNLTVQGIAQDTDYVYVVGQFTDVPGR